MGWKEFKESRGFTKLITWAFFFTLYAFNFVVLYLIVTLNVIGIVVVVLIVVLQNLFGKFSPSYIQFLRDTVHPERFFNKA